MASETAVRHETGIQWTHVPGYIGATWNPTTGCTRVSPGCDHCYAFTLHDQRFVKNRDAAYEFCEGQRAMGLLLVEKRGTEAIAYARSKGAKLPFGAQYDVPFSMVQMLGDERLDEPLRKRTPHAYFVDSMSDLFHEDVSDLDITRVWDVMEGAPTHLFMVLTKRPERMCDFVQRRRQQDIDYADAFARTPTVAMQNSPAAKAARRRAEAGPARNIWLGVSAEDQERADERIPLLLDTPAAVRFVSYEPALGPIDFTRLCAPEDEWAETFNALDGTWENTADKAHAWDRGLDWVIVGGESGPRARPFDVAWARSVVSQGRAAGVPVFVKQMGSRPYDRNDAGFEGESTSAWPEGTVATGDTAIQGVPSRIHLKHSHGSNPDEWPEDLRVREFPAVAS